MGLILEARSSPFFFPYHRTCSLWKAAIVSLLPRPSVLRIVAVLWRDSIAEAPSKGPDSLLHTCSSDDIQIIESSTEVI